MEKGVEKELPQPWLRQDARQIGCEPVLLSCLPVDVGLAHDGKAGADAQIFNHLLLNPQRAILRIEDSAAKRCRVFDAKSAFDIEELSNQHACIH
jgi:hypothetical protein